MIRRRGRVRLRHLAILVCSALPSLATLFLVREFATPKPEPPTATEARPKPPDLIGWTLPTRVSPETPKLLDPNSVLRSEGNHD